MKSLRLDRLLSNMGYGTRSQIKKLIKDGQVSLNGHAAIDSAVHVNPESDLIEIDGEKLVYKEHVYIMMNKPADVVSATYDPKLETVVDLLPEEYSHFGVAPVGRLDIDTEGLLFLTDDGQLAHNIISPKKHVPKKYYAIISGEVTQRDIERFKKGLRLGDGTMTMPSELKILKSGSTSEIELIIFEGKFHQVKRMFLAVGKEVAYLKRLEIGSLKLDESLKPGEFRELTEEELDSIKKSN